MDGTQTETKRGHSHTSRLGEQACRQPDKRRKEAGMQARRGGNARRRTGKERGEVGMQAE